MNSNSNVSSLENESRNRTSQINMTISNNENSAAQHFYRDSTRKQHVLSAPIGYIKRVNVENNIYESNRSVIENVNTFERPNNDTDMLNIPDIPAAYDTGSNDSSMNQDRSETISNRKKHKSISDKREKQHREYTEIMQGLQHILPECSEDTCQDVTQSMGYVDPDSLIVFEEIEDAQDTNDSEEEVSNDHENQNTSNNSASNNNRKGLSDLKSLHKSLNKTLEKKYVSNKTPLEMDEQNMVETRVTSGCNIDVYFSYINDKLSSMDIKAITDDSIFTRLYNVTVLHHFTANDISGVYKFIHILLESMPQASKQVSEFFKDDLIYTNCDGKMFYNRCRSLKINVSRPLLIGMSKADRTIFTVFDSVDYEAEKTNKLYTRYKSNSSNGSNNTSNSQSNMDAAFFHTKLDKIKGYGPRLLPDILLFPYTSLIMYIQQILLIPGCIDSFCNKTKEDINTMLSEYNAASSIVDAKERVRQQNQILLKYKIGLFGLMKLRMIQNRDFDYCISIAVHSDGAGTNTTFNEFSAESTYIIQVEILSISRTDDNLYNHIVYASSDKIGNIAYYMLMQEIQALKQGMDMFVNMGTEIKKKKIIVYQDMIKGDYKEITDLVSYCSPSSKMPFYLDYTVAKTSAEMFFLMSFINNEQLYYTEFIDMLNNTDLPVFTIYTLGDKPLESIQKTNLVPHTFKKCYLYRTNESINDSFQCDVKSKPNLKKLKTNQLFLLFLGNTLFYTFCIDVFHIDYNISKRLGAILFAFTEVKKINQTKHDELLSQFPHDHARFFHEKIDSNKLDYFKFQINGDIMDHLTTVLQAVHSPYFGFSMTKMKFDREIISKLIIVDTLHLFAVVIPLCFEALSIDDCYLLHPISLFSTIIKMHFDTTFDINDPKYEYKRRIDNFLYELFFILHEDLYIDCMHLLQYSPDIFKLHNRADTFCARNERLIKMHKGNIHQSSNKGKTAAINHSDYEIARIHEANDEASNTTNLSTTEQENSYKLIDIISNNSVYQDPLIKEYLLNRYKTSFMKFQQNNTNIEEDKAYMRWIKILKSDKMISVAKNIRCDKYSFSAFNPNNRSDKCIVRIIEKIELTLNPDYPNNTVNQGTLFGRLKYILKVKNRILFCFDEIYVTTPKPDSCLFNDYTNIKYTYDASKLKLIYSIEEVDLLPVAYLQHEVAFEFVSEISSGTNTLTHYYKKVSFYDLIYDKQRIETSQNISTYTTACFTIDSHSHFDMLRYL